MARSTHVDLGTRASHGEFVVEAPALQDIKDSLPESPPIHAESSELAETDFIQELLIDELRDILHAKKQLLKACLRWRKPPPQPTWRSLVPRNAWSTMRLLLYDREEFGAATPSFGGRPTS